MVDVNVKYDSHVGARLLDFFGSTTPWHRSLWTLGLVLTLNELIEAIGAVRTGILYQNSVEDLSRLAMSLAGIDPGVGAAEQRKVLQAALRTDCLLYTSTANIQRQNLRAHRFKVARGGILGEQAGRHFVDPPVSALRGKDGRHQQLPRIAVVQRAGHVGIHLVQPAQDLVHARAALSGGLRTFHFGGHRLD